MRKVLALLVMALFLTTPSMAEKPTSLYTPVVKQADYATRQSSTDIWSPSVFDCVVCDSFIMSTDTAKLNVTLAASSTIVKVSITASDPVVNPPNFLWKGAKDETIRVTTSPFGNLSITLSGWEEN